LRYKKLRCTSQYNISFAVFGLLKTKEKTFARQSPTLIIQVLGFFCTRKGKNQKNKNFLKNFSLQPDILPFFCPIRWEDLILHRSFKSEYRYNRYVTNSARERKPHKRTTDINR
jgi:hypothetical protein